MRNIKFRYVIKYDGDKIQTFTLSLDEIQKHCGTWDEVNIFCENVGIVNYEIIARDLFTGLKDKYGKEIYEGDIVKYLLPDGNDETFTEYIEEVVFEEGSFNLEAMPLGAVNEEGEIVGNIYEHNNLLNK